MRDPDGDEHRTVTTHDAATGVTLSPVVFPDVVVDVASWFEGL